MAPTPIIKWVGGKSQIIDKVMENFPTSIRNYHEICVGGGSVLIALLTHIKNKRIMLSGHIYAFDLNESLISLYKNVQSNHEELYRQIQILSQEFQNCGTRETINRKPANILEAKECKENYYYWTRSRYNALVQSDKNSVLGSALFVFLNKTCFRGLFREGPNGFNVPYGNYKNPQIINKENLDEVHELIQGVVFGCCDFTESLGKIGVDDFVYIDPPYVPETQTSFVSYTKDGFGKEKHVALFKLCNQLSLEKKKVLISNSDVPFVRESFPTDTYNTESIMCKRSINSKKPGTKIAEVLIRNF